jgi:hypothetical protein
MAVRFLFGNTELNLRLLMIVAGTQLVPSGQGYWWGSGGSGDSAGFFESQARKLDRVGPDMLE